MSDARRMIVVVGAGSGIGAALSAHFHVISFLGSPEAR
jgi:NAD(P)-dependent dehydrogenase (short-subunit alcohol dehydrogenase family)